LTRKINILIAVILQKNAHHRHFAFSCYWAVEKQIFSESTFS